MALTVLVEASPFDAATGVATPVYLAGGGSRPYTHKGRTDWWSGVVDLPLFSTAIDFTDAGWGSIVLPPTGAVKFSAHRTSRISTLAGYNWVGASIVVSTGDDAADPATFTPVITGTVAGSKVQNGQLVLTLTDKSGDLSKPVVPDTFAGTGGVEGSIEARGRVKRISWGQVENVEGFVLDPANNIYEFGTPLRQLNAFLSVKDKGREGPVVTVAWAGSAAATLTALIAATPPVGGGAVAPSIACVKWWTRPAGPITADIQGEGPGYPSTAPAIAARLIAIYGAGITVGNLAEAVGWQPAIAGLHCDNSSETVGSALDRLLLPIRLPWVLDASGVLTFRQITWTGSVATLTADMIDRDSTLSPTKTRRLGYLRNHRVHTDGEISAALIDGSTSYTLVDVAGSYIPTPSIVAKANPADGWNTKAYIVEGGSTPFVSAVTHENTMIGITTNPTVDATFSSLDYALQGTGGRVYRYRNGTGVDVGSFADGDRLGLYSDGTTIHYLKNGVEIVAAKHAANTPGETLYPAFAIFSGLGSIQGITYSAAGLLGTTGATGAPAVTGYLTNDAVTLAADAAGNVLSYTGAGGTFRVVAGGADVSGSFTYAVQSNPQALTDATLIHATTGVYSISGGFDTGENNATITFRATGTGSFAGTTIDKTFALSKSKTGTAGAAGGAGADAKLVTVTADRAFITYDGTGALSPGTQTTTFTAVLQNTSATINWTIQRLDGTALTASTYLSATTGASVTLTAANFNTARDTTEGVVVTATITDGVTVSDRVTIARVRAGSNGLDGTNGTPGTNGTNGANAYFHVAYADSSDGTVNFTTGAPGSRTYIGVYSDSTPADSSSPGAYTWSKFVGEDGSNGTPGAPGDDGAPSYVHFAWANDATGSTGFSTTVSTGKLYIGVYSDFTLADSTNPADYTWTLVKGADGSTGAPGVSPILLTLSAYSIDVAADSANVTKTGALPKGAIISLKQGATDLTPAGVTFAYSDGGGGAFVMSAGTLSTTTPLSLTTANAPGWVDVIVSYASVNYTQRIAITRTQDPQSPPSQTSAYVSVYGGSSSGATTYDGTGILAPELVLAANGSGQIAASFSAEYYTDTPPASVRSLTVGARIEIAPQSTGVFTAPLSENIGSNASWDKVDANPGVVSTGGTFTGLTAGAMYRMRVNTRKNSGSNPNVVISPGDFSVTQ
jgi:hypothetical protein